MSEQQPSNRPNKEFNTDYKNRLENLDKDLSSAKGTYMKAAQDIRADMAEVISEYNAKGGMGKAMKHLIDVDTFIRNKILNDNDKLDDVLIDEFMFMADQLGLFDILFEKFGPDTSKEVETARVEAIAQTKSAIIAELAAMGVEIDDEVIIDLDITATPVAATEATDEVEEADEPETEDEPETTDDVVEDEPEAEPEPETVDEDDVHVENEEIIDPDAVETTDEDLAENDVEDPDGFTDATDETAGETTDAADEDADMPDDFDPNTEVEVEGSEEVDAPTGEEE